MIDRLATIVIVGRPNVGKSLLFNKLLRRRQSIVHSSSGMTIDFLKERLQLSDKKEAWLIDTGGVAGEKDWRSQAIKKQMKYASENADYFILVTDAQKGCLAMDMILAQEIRQYGTIPWIVVANKSEGMSPLTACADFYSLGAKETFAVSAKHGHGVSLLRQNLENQLENFSHPSDFENSQPISMTVVGRPNVGKSSFINRLLAKERVVVSEQPGTTRDCVVCEIQDRNIILVDTPGIRRQRSKDEQEKLSLAVAAEKLVQTDCVLFLFNLAEGITYQDKRILSLIVQKGCSLVLIANKKDLLPYHLHAKSLRESLAAINVGFPYFSFSTSMLPQSRPPFKAIFKAVETSAKNSKQKLSTPHINNILSNLLRNRLPRRIGRISPKLRYAHQGGTSPLSIVIHGNNVETLDTAYKRYLANAFASELKVVGCPIRLKFQSEKNPYV